MLADVKPLVRPEADPELAADFERVYGKWIRWRQSRPVQVRNPQQLELEAVR